MTSAGIDAVDVSTYTVETPEPEADGTLTWDATTVVVVHVHAGQATGLGWTYSSPAAAAVISEELAGVVTGRDPFDIAGAWEAMHRHCRNLGTRGLVMQALSAVDIALWDLKARLHDEPLSTLLGQTRPDRADLWLGRLHLPGRHPARRTGRDLAGGWVRRDENQDRPGLGHELGARY